MISSESMIQSFVIKISVEETADETGQTLWRGHITHIPSRRRVYIKELNDVIHFIVPYLEKMGIELDQEWSS